MASQGNPRSTAIRAVANANKLDLEIVDTDIAKGPLSTEYLKLNKLGKVPSFVGEDGYELTEAIAIAIYSTPLCPPRTKAQACTYMMRNIINNSYPCLKTTVENQSHSDSKLLRNLSSSYS